MRDVSSIVFSTISVVCERCARADRRFSVDALSQLKADEQRKWRFCRPNLLGWRRQQANEPRKLPGVPLKNGGELSKNRHPLRPEAPNVVNLFLNRLSIIWYCIFDLIRYLVCLPCLLKQRRKCVAAGSVK